MTQFAYNDSMPSGPRVPNIAIIGLEGSGKTVLATTLAKRLSTIDARGVFLNPQGVKTLKYVEGVWHTLQSGDWPPSTPPGELFQLKWKFQVVGELECDVHLIDAAGQDLRLLFGDEQILSVGSIPRHLQELAEYCRVADIILFLINLKDFVGQGNPEQRTANEAAIKSAMDYLGDDGRPRRVCLVLTQTDLYCDLARERGGWLELAAEAVPYVFSAHIRVHQVAVYPVSAVADTQVVVDRDGTPRRVPTADFRSEGLDEVVTWLTTQVRDVKRELDQEAEAEAEEAALAVQQTSGPRVVQPPQPPEESPWGTIIGVVVAIIIGIFVLRGCIPGCSGSRPPVTWKCGVYFGTFNDDVWLKNTSKFTISNVELTIDVVNRAGEHVPKKLYAPGIYSGETYTWSNAISVPRQTPTAKVECDQNR